MALDYNQVTAITKKYFIPKLSDVIFDSNALMKRAKSKFYEKADGGERVMMPLGYAQTTSSGWYTGSDTLSTTDNQSITAAALEWKSLYGNITILRREELQNRGKSAVLSLVKNKVKMCEKTLRDKMGTGLYSNATDAKSIIGLRQWIGAANTVGGISQSSYSWWQGQVDSTTTALSLKAMQDVFEDASIDDDQPTVVMATRAIYNLYYSLLTPMQRFVDSETAKGGFSSLMFNGIPLISDSKAVGLMMLNENYLHLIAHKDEDFRFQPFESPLNQAAKVAKIFWFGVFGSSNNRLHGYMSAITS